MQELKRRLRENASWLQEKLSKQGSGKLKDNWPVELLTEGLPFTSEV
jgi:hypothetical protein